MRPKTIAIDGTAASGKSTLGSALAKRYQYLYLDTGVMYRAVTWYVLHTHTDVTDEAGVSALAAEMNLQILPPTVNDQRQTTVLVDEEDVTWLIRSPQVDANVSRVAAYGGVREILTKRQRDIAAAGPVVMVGRDIGTVVLPEADLKIFVEASVEVRARRRYDECRRRNEPVVFEDILTAMAQRDKMDRERDISPMVAATDAHIVHTDHLSKDEMVAQVIQMVEHLGQGTPQG